MILAYLPATFRGSFVCSSAFGVIEWEVFYAQTGSCVMPIGTNSGCSVTRMGVRHDGARCAGRPDATGIARWYGVDTWTLARLNGIVNPNRIYVSQRLLIPVAGSSVMPGTTYIVRAGDTLTAIAARAGVSVWAIAQANAIYNLQHIYVGQRLVVPGAQPVPAPRPTTQPIPQSQAWRGEYYANATQTGAPCLVRYDGAINFRWGTGRPSTCVGTDQFSVRWDRTIAFIGGLYRFKVRVDDGVRIYVDGSLVLDAWRTQPETAYQADVVLTSGAHTVTVVYYEDTGVSTIQFSFTRLGAAPVGTPAPTVVPTAAATPVSAAWYGEYYNGTGLTGTPAATRWDGAIGFEWGTGAPIGGTAPDDFSVRWTRTAHFYSDNYALCAMADDGVRLYLDGALVLDEWHANNGIAYCGQADVAAGLHQIRAEYYEDGGDALIYVWWERR